MFVSYLLMDHGVLIMCVCGLMFVSYLLMDHGAGGDLFSRIHPPGSSGPVHGLKDDAALFYGASLVIILGYMHSREVPPHHVYCCCC